MAYLIGIAGGTGAGKSTVVRRVTERFGGCLVDLDSYYVDRGHLRPDERGRINYDEPAAIDVALLLDHLQRLAAGEPVQKPRYSFEKHTRVGVETVPPMPLIAVDGLFALWWEPLRSLFNLKVFVDAPPDLRLIRRIRRDVIERGRTVDSVLAQYLSTVRPMHERYVEPTRAYADLVVANVGPVEECIESVAASVRATVAPSSQKHVAHQG